MVIFSPQFLLNQVKNGDFSVRESSIPDFVSLLAYSLRLPVTQGTDGPVISLSMLFYFIIFRTMFKLHLILLAASTLLSYWSKTVS